MHETKPLLRFGQGGVLASVLIIMAFAIKYLLVYLQTGSLSVTEEEVMGGWALGAAGCALVVLVTSIQVRSGIVSKSNMRILLMAMVIIFSTIIILSFIQAEFVDVLFGNGGLLGTSISICINQKSFQPKQW